MYAEPAVEVPVEQRIQILVADSSEVEAFGEDNEIPGEAVAADVRRLPHPRGVDLSLQPVVERPPVLRAAAVSLPVGAHDHERVLDRHSGHLAAQEGVGKVVFEQVVVVLELERVEALLARSRVAEVQHAASLPSPGRLLDEEEPRMAEPRELVAQVSLERLREEAAGQNVPIPEAPVFDEEPAVDAARGCPEALAGRLRDVGAKSPFHAHSHVHRLPPLVRRTLHGTFGGIALVAGTSGAF